MTVNKNVLSALLNKIFPSIKDYDPRSVRYLGDSFIDSSRQRAVFLAKRFLNELPQVRYNRSHKLRFLLFGFDAVTQSVSGKE